MMMNNIQTYDEFLNELFQGGPITKTILKELEELRRKTGPKALLSVQKLDDFVPFDMLFNPDYEDAKIIGSVYFKKEKPDMKEIQNYIIQNVTKSPELFELIPDKYLTDKIKKIFPDLAMAKEFGMFDND